MKHLQISQSPYTDKLLLRISIKIKCSGYMEKTKSYELYELHTFFDDIIRHFTQK